MLTYNGYNKFLHIYIEIYIFVTTKFLTYPQQNFVLNMYKKQLKKIIIKYLRFTVIEYLRIAIISNRISKMY